MTTANVLKWSQQFQISSESRFRRLQGDKITLPQSALEALLAAAPVVDIESHRPQRYQTNFNPFNQYSFAAELNARSAFVERQQQLPHPLTFRLVNPGNGRTVYAGIREFSAEEGYVGLSPFLSEALGLETGGDSGTPTRSATPNGDVISTKSNSTALVTIHAEQIEKGIYVRLRPLEAGYDAEDWKALLEKHLRDNFTTLTNGEVLTVPGFRHAKFKFLIDKFEPEGNGICIVDTDLSVDIEALNEEQARETLDKKLAKSRKAPGAATGSSYGGTIVFNQEVQHQVLLGEYVDYELKQWDRGSDLSIRLEATNDQNIQLMISPFSAHQRAKPRLDEHMFADLSLRPSKRVKLSHTNVELEAAESLRISVHGPTSQADTSQAQPLSYTLHINSYSTNALGDQNATEAQPGMDDVICKNCQQVVPKRTLPLHEAFCYRNNVPCPKCKQVFLKSSEAWKTHWHCPHDDEYGSGALSKENHDYVFHPPTPLQCPGCEFEAFNIPILAHHRTSTCPAKEILCQFCHLVVPQQGPDDPVFTDPEVLLSGLTPHELADGARTTECHLCSKIVRLRDLKTHLLLHDRDRISKPKPYICVNSICGRTIKAGNEFRVQKEQLGLCDECFGPLYHSAHDPEGKALRRRIERRLLQQLMAGCGKEWCHNAEWCRTGRKHSSGQDTVITAKDALPMVKPILEGIIKGDSSQLRFCVDEASQIRRATAEMISSEGSYQLEWCIKALEEERNNMNRARDWLKDRAPKVDEVIG